MALAPRFGLIAALQVAAPPPPSSSVRTTLLPSALKVAWLGLEERGESVPLEATNPNLTDHGAHSMPRMASKAKISQLASATGTEADRLFLTLMIRHHEGALAMVEDHAENPADPRVEEMAADM